MREFVASKGDLDATLGKHPFRTILTRVLRYAVEPWPSNYGARRVADVLEEGFFVGTALACVATTAPGSGANVGGVRGWAA